MTRLFAAAVLLLSSASVAAQVAFDSATQGSSLMSDALALNHSTSGSDRFACYGFTWYGNADIASVTYGASAMTATIPTMSFSGESRLKAALYCIVNPPTSSTTVTVTMDGSVDFIAGGVVSFTGVDQSDPTGTPVSYEGTNGPASINLTLAENELGLDVVGGTFSSVEAAGDQDSRVEVENPGGNDSSIGMGTLAGVGTVTFEWTLNQVVPRFVHGAVAIKPSSSQQADTTPDQFSFSDQTDVELSTTITSAPVEIKGIDEAIECAATGGTIDVNGDNDFQATREVDNNDQIRARHTSSNSYSTAVNTVVDCNGVSDTFTSTTKAEPEPEPGVSHLSIYLYLRQMRK